MGNSTDVTLKIVQFRNPSGQHVYRVSGMIHGRRVQKNFPTRSEAERYMNALLASAYQGDSSPVRSAATALCSAALGCRTPCLNQSSESMTTAEGS